MFDIPREVTGAAIHSYIYPIIFYFETTHRKQQQK